MKSTVESNDNQAAVNRKIGKQNKRSKNSHHRRGRVGKRTKEMVEIAKERIRILLSLAESEMIQKKESTAGT